jgi:hypothetical protein
MLGGIARFVVFRLLGGRALLLLALLGWVRGRLGRRRTSAYQPSQGESQIVQREPR